MKYSIFIRIIKYKYYFILIISFITTINQNYKHHIHFQKFFIITDL